LKKKSIKREIKNDYVFLYSEIQDILKTLNESLLKLEQDLKNRELLNIIFKNVHTLKGLSCFFDINDLVYFAELLEQVIDSVINKSAELNAKFVDILFQATDHLTEILEAQIKNEKTESREDLIRELENACKIKNKNIEIIAENLDESEDIVDEENLQEFLISTYEFLDILEKNVFDYEKTDSQEKLNEIFRIVHTIKSDSGYVGLKKVAKYMHILENLLDKLRQFKIIRTTKIVDIILSSTDLIKKIVDGLKRRSFNILKNSDIQMLADLVLVYENKSENEIKFQNNRIVFATEKEKAFVSQVTQYKEMIESSTKDYPLDMEKKKILTRLLQSLQNAAKYMGTENLLQKIDGIFHVLNDNNDDVIKDNLVELLSDLNVITQNSNIKADNVREIILPHKFNEKPNHNIESGSTPGEPFMVNSKQKELQPEPESEISTIRIDTRKVDSFSNMIGELLIAKNAYEYLLNDLIDNDKISPEREKLLNDNLHLFSRLTDDLQSGIMTLRMVPIKGVFQKFNRVVRDISRLQNKKIGLEMTGVETEIDKKVADTLSDPLIHLIRNSCDHGIETPEERVNMGKTEKGTITLNAFQEGNELYIEIKDDGKGLDKKRIIEKAQSIGIDTTNYDENSIVNLIFAPGFSTKSEVSDLSGRGVGMDVVNTTLKNLSGKIHVDSKEGKGTNITLTIPVSLGLSQSLLVEINKSIYAIPVKYVKELLKLSPSDIFRLHDRLGFSYRGEIYPCAYLQNLLSNINNEKNDSLTKLLEDFQHNLVDELTIVILETNNGKFGIIVDKLLKNIELAIKQIPESLSKIEVVRGVSILGDGKVVLVLNPEKLV
jgi:two-component system, chemotaxis family, sensor kinase CheA